eukprot:CAMPEP_0172932932 /NCGR_PEP_ID=MMETSP1075-20121228/220251_1 /TAXON_ID=2916 /ORGANISM="Ceratium fusus, Strain PA161109" /LENGTH=111 /DNA_ID=CAMNT_0013794267 /DNA_START=502 /DNA_END=837 /DNA_ORIENTATION=-
MRWAACANFLIPNEASSWSRTLASQTPRHQTPLIDPLHESAIFPTTSTLYTFQCPGDANSVLAAIPPLTTVVVAINPSEQTMAMLSSIQEFTLIDSAVGPNHPPRWTHDAA